MTRRGYQPTQIDVEPFSADELDWARSFLEQNLRDCADEWRERAGYEEDDPKLALFAAADRLEELADSLADVSAEALAAYAKALRTEADGPAYIDFMLCSVTAQIGFTFNPQSIDDLCRLYASAVECFYDSGAEGSMDDFFAEFVTTAHT
jgi:hypothetical protein